MGPMSRLRVYLVVVALAMTVMVGCTSKPEAPGDPNVGDPLVTPSELAPSTEGTGQATATRRPTGATKPGAGGLLPPPPVASGTAVIPSRTGPPSTKYPPPSTTDDTETTSQQPATSSGSTTTAVRT